MNSFSLVVVPCWRAMSRAEHTKIAFTSWFWGCSAQTPYAFMLCKSQTQVSGKIGIGYKSAWAVFWNTLWGDYGLGITPVCSHKVQVCNQGFESRFHKGNGGRKRSNMTEQKHSYTCTAIIVSKNTTLGAPKLSISKGNNMFSPAAYFHVFLWIQ